jgi:cytochrome P450
MSTLSRLLSHYERGALTRRQLIADLTMLLTAGTTTSAAGLKVGRLDHIALNVSPFCQYQ